MIALRKRPEDQLDYDVDFTRWLTGDVITTAEAIADPEEIYIQSVEVFDQVVKVWISGGQVGKTYKISVSATTDKSRVKEESFILRVTEC